ncbi:MAG: cytochrome c oxidase assembly protein, partial [Acidimicrobiales bacterium]
MGFLTAHWSFDPFLVVMVAIAAVNERGVRRLARRSVPERARRRRRRAWAFYGGLVVLALTVASPVDYYSGRYFFVHMLQHLLLAFAAPSLVVVGAPWVSFAFGLPVTIRRRVGRALLVSPRTAWLRKLGRALNTPWVAVAAFNVDMVAWHVPWLFDAAETNSPVHIWLMHGSLFVTGLFFWLQFIASHPFRPRLSPGGQISALLGTNAVMVFLAMAMSWLTADSWYSVYAHVPGVTLNPFADQQIGAGVLWVCGDFWCFPALFKAFRRAQEDPEGLEGLL